MSKELYQAKSVDVKIANENLLGKTDKLESELKSKSDVS